MPLTLDMADVKPSVANLVIVTMLAVVGFSLLKFAMRRWPIPGLVDLVNAL